MLNSNIFYKKCQEVDTITRLMLLGAPNTIDDKQIHKIMDEELMELKKVEKEDPKSPVAWFDNRTWVKYSITCKYLWECHGREWKRRNRR
jgi:hypothetical protein